MNTRVYLDGEEYIVSYKFYEGSEPSMYDPGDAPCAEIQEVLDVEGEDVFDELSNDDLEKIELQIIEKEKNEHFLRGRSRSMPFLARMDRDEFYA